MPAPSSECSRRNISRSQGVENILRFICGQEESRVRFREQQFVISHLSSGQISEINCRASASCYTHFRERDSQAAFGAVVTCADEPVSYAFEDRGLGVFFNSKTERWRCDTAKPQKMVIFRASELPTGLA